VEEIEEMEEEEDGIVRSIMVDMYRYEKY